MTKSLTDRELLEIVQNIVNGDDTIIEERGTYIKFCEDLAKLVTSYCGGDVNSVSGDMSDGMRFCAHIGWNESVPEDGGIYSKYDTNISIPEWRDDEWGKDIGNGAVRQCRLCFKVAVFIDNGETCPNCKLVQ